MYLEIISDEQQEKLKHKRYFDMFLWYCLWHVFPNYAEYCLLFQVLKNVLVDKLFFIRMF